MPNDTPEPIEEEKTVPVPRQTNRELVFGYDDQIDHDTRRDIYWSEWS